MASELFDSRSQRRQRHSVPGARTTNSTRGSTSLRPAPLPPPQPDPMLLLSKFSDAPVNDSVWVSQDFMLGAGMIVIRPEPDPSQSKILVLYEGARKYHFLPKGRKDIGESVEQAALREAYEESGYPVTFMPIFLPHHQPPPNNDKAMALQPCHEAISVDLHYWPPTTRRGRQNGTGGEYLVTWFLGQVDPNAEYNPNTRMADEQHYESLFLPYHEAMTVLHPKYQMILQYAWTIYHHTLKTYKEIEVEELKNRTESLAVQEDSK